MVLALLNFIEVSMNQYRIGNLKIGWSDMGFVLAVDEMVNVFQVDDNEVSDFDIEFQFEEMNMDWFITAEYLKKTGSYELLKLDKGMFLLNHWAACRFAYGLWVDDFYSNNSIPVYVNRKIESEMPMKVSRFLGTIGLHSVLLQKDAPVIHASYIDYNGKAILFTAPSGTGKSTQASLWKQLAGAEIINGDRVLLRKSNEVWHAFGYPCCGSSQICINRTLPLAAIIVLEQGKENRVEMLSALQKIRALVAATEVYLWEQREMDKAFSLAEQIVKQIPVIKLFCRPNEQAVEVLKVFLEENGYV